MQDKKSTKLSENVNIDDNNSNKFNELANSSDDNHISFFETLKKLNWKEEFRMDKLLQIPCFRDAGMVGVASMTVLCTTMYISQLRNGTSRYSILNWSMTSLIFGSVLGWEQCRYRRRKNQLIADVAIETVKSKKRPMLIKKDDMQKETNRTFLQKEWKEHANDTEKIEKASKKWYKFW